MKNQITITQDLQKVEQRIKHQNFIRIGWQEALNAMHSALEIRYKTKGKLMLMKDFGYDDIGEFYDEPTFVDLYLEEENIKV